MTNARLQGLHRHHTNSLYGPGADSGSQGAAPEFENTDVSDVEIGDVVVLDLTADNSIKLCTVQGDENVVGVVADTGPYATGEMVPVLVSGFFSGVKVTGSVAVGDYLITDSTTGTAKVRPTTGPLFNAPAFARATSVDNMGVCDAIIFDVERIEEWPEVMFDMSDQTDGIEVDFSTPDFFEEDSCKVWLNGLLQRPLVDYTEFVDLDGITMTAPPEDEDELVVVYLAQVT